jgi:hypothetical protein
VVLLVGNSPWNRHTVATILDSGANVVGICVADDTVAGLPLGYIRRSVKRRGAAKTADQILGRLRYKLLSARADRRHLRELFDLERCKRVLDDSEVPVHFTKAYGDPQTVAWVKERAPDVLVVHTGAWVGQSVRRLARAGLVIGGHPGLTPRYRGAHSAFWALYRGRPEEVGYSVFHLDRGVDTGDLIEQGTLEIDAGDTYFSLGWKGMKAIAAVQARLLADCDRGLEVARKPHAYIPEGSEYPVPGLTHYLVYLWRRRRARWSRRRTGSSAPGGIEHHTDDRR